MKVMQKLVAADKWARAKVGGVLAVAGAAATVSVPASAATIDVAEVVAAIKEYAGATSPIVLIGGAVLLVTVVIASLVWVRRSVK